MQSISCGVDIQVAEWTWLPADISYSVAMAMRLTAGFVCFNASYNNRGQDTQYSALNSFPFEFQNPNAGPLGKTELTMFISVNTIFKYCTDF